MRNVTDEYKSEVLSNILKLEIVDEKSNSVWKADGDIYSAISFQSQDFILPETDCGSSDVLQVYAQPEWIEDNSVYVVIETATGEHIYSQHYDMNYTGDLNSDIENYKNNITKSIAYITKHFDEIVQLISESESE